MRSAILILTLTATAWAADPSWQVRLQYIEACSCNLFCPCYFNDRAAHQHGGEPRCNFNNVGRVLQGKYGDVDLTGLKFWLSGDLGAEWGKGQADWLVATFEPSATKAQIDGLMAVLGKVYHPVQWEKVDTDSTTIEWTLSPDGKTARAKLGNGKGEVSLTRFDGTDSKRGAQVQNVKYFAATWNGPFTLYHSDHYYKGFGHSYELKQANGFVITVEHTSDGKRVPAPAKKAN